MSQELIPQPITVLIPSEDVQKYESGEISLETLKRGKNGRFIKQLDTLKADNNFYSKNTTIQVLNNYIFTETLYSKKLKEEITIISNQLKNNEQLIQKLIQLKFNDIEAKVIKFNNYLEQNLDNNPNFTNKEVIHVGMDTISTLTSNFTYLLEDFIKSNQIMYIKGGQSYDMSISEYNNLPTTRRPNIKEVITHNFSDHIIHFITLSLLNNINDLNLINFKETGKFLKNWHSDLLNIKERLINTVNFLIVGIVGEDDIYNICYHKHNGEIFKLYNLEKILSLDKRGTNIHDLIKRDYKNTHDQYSKYRDGHPANNKINSDRINSIKTIISLIDLCDEITNKFQNLEEIQEENQDFNNLLLDLTEYSITLSTSVDN